MSSIQTILDREKVNRIQFSVCVTDGQPSQPCGTSTLLTDMPKVQVSSKVFTVTALVSVTLLDENDNRPRFISKGPFTIMENKPKFSQVEGHLTAVDPDEGGNGVVSLFIMKRVIYHIKLKNIMLVSTLLFLKNALRFVYFLIITKYIN